MSMEDASDLLGPFARWQILSYMLDFISKMIAAFHIFAPVFISAKMEYVCSDHSRQIIGQHNTTSSRNHEAIGPNSSISAESDQCHFRNSNGTVEECSKWNYYDSVFASTIFSDFDLVCNRSAFVSISTSCYMAGLIFGLFIFGHVSDRYGRKPAVIAALLLIICAGLGVAFSSSIAVFIVLRLFVGVGQAGPVQIAHVYTTELLPTLKREYMQPSLSLGFFAGSLILPGLSLALPNWRNLYLLISTFPAIPVLILWAVQLESVKWLVASRRFNKACRTVELINKFNGTVTPQLEVRMNAMKDRIEKESGSKKMHLGHLFKTKTMVKQTLILMYLWPTCTFFYYGISLSVATIPGNIFLNFSLGALGEILGACLLITLSRFFPRKLLLKFFLGLATLAGMLFLTLSKGDLSYGLILFFLGKVSSILALILLYTITCELYPTVVRGMALTFLALVGRFGAVAAPFLSQLEVKTNSAFPMVFCGILAALGALLSCMLKETRGRRLPDTFEEFEEMHR